MLSSAVAELHDLDMLTQGRRDGEDVTITNVSDDYGMLVLTGPRARDVLAGLTDADLGNQAFPWLTAREITVAGVPPEEVYFDTFDGGSIPLSEM